MTPENMAAAIAELQRELGRRADPAKRAWWESYVKGAAFRGKPMAAVRGAVDGFVAGHPELRESDLKRLAFALLREPLTEDKLAGILLLSEHLLDGLGRDDLPAMRAALAAGHLGDWGSCDWFCVKVLGRLLARSPDAQRLADEIVGWTASDDLWLRRAGLVAFADVARHGDGALEGLARRVLEGAGRNVRDPRRFAQTSVGWVLRELSRAHPDAVREFLAEHGDRMSAEARRAASARLRAA